VISSINWLAAHFALAAHYVKANDLPLRKASEFLHQECLDFGSFDVEGGKVAMDGPTDVGGHPSIISSYDNSYAHRSSFPRSLAIIAI
jgi:hypothetical protein